MNHSSTCTTRLASHAERPLLAADPHSELMAMADDFSAAACTPASCRPAYAAKRPASATSFSPSASAHLAADDLIDVHGMPTESPLRTVPADAISAVVDWVIPFDPSPLRVAQQGDRGEEESTVLTSAEHPEECENASSSGRSSSVDFGGRGGGFNDNWSLSKAWDASVIPPTASAVAVGEQMSDGEFHEEIPLFKPRHVRASSLRDSMAWDKEFQTFSEETFITDEEAGLDCLMMGAPLVWRTTKSPKPLATEKRQSLAANASPFALNAATDENENGKSGGNRGRSGELSGSGGGVLSSCNVNTLSAQQQKDSTKSPAPSLLKARRSGLKDISPWKQLPATQEDEQLVDGTRELKTPGALPSTVAVSAEEKKAPNEQDVTSTPIAPISSSLGSDACEGVQKNPLLNVSMAWDKAFQTEKGVLDSIDLDDPFERFSKLHALSSTEVTATEGIIHRDEKEQTRAEKSSVARMGDAAAADEKATLSGNQSDAAIALQPWFKSTRTAGTSLSHGPGSPAPDDKVASHDGMSQSLAPSKLRPVGLHKINKFTLENRLAEIGEEEERKQEDGTSNASGAEEGTSGLDISRGNLSTTTGAVLGQDGQSKYGIDPADILEKVAAVQAQLLDSPRVRHLRSQLPAMQKNTASPSAEIVAAAGNSEGTDPDKGGKIGSPLCAPEVGSDICKALLPSSRLRNPVQQPRANSVIEAAIQDGTRLRLPGRYHQGSKKQGTEEEVQADAGAETAAPSGTAGHEAFPALRQEESKSRLVGAGFLGVRSMKGSRDARPPTNGGEHSLRPEASTGCIGFLRSGSGGSKLPGSPGPTAKRSATFTASNRTQAIPPAFAAPLKSVGPPRRVTLNDPTCRAPRVKGGEVGGNAPRLVQERSRTNLQGVKVPGNITPGTRTPGTRTPGTRTPGNRTPGNRTPGGPSSPSLRSRSRPVSPSGNSELDAAEVAQRLRLARSRPQSPTSSGTVDTRSTDSAWTNPNGWNCRSRQQSPSTSMSSAHGSDDGHATCASDGWNDRASLRSESSSVISSPSLSRLPDIGNFSLGTGDPSGDGRISGLRKPSPRLSFFESGKGRRRNSGSGGVSSAGASRLPSRPQHGTRKPLPRPPPYAKKAVPPGSAGMKTVQDGIPGKQPSDRWPQGSTASRIPTMAVASLYGAKSGGGVGGVQQSSSIRQSAHGNSAIQHDDCKGSLLRGGQANGAAVPHALSTRVSWDDAKKLVDAFFESQGVKDSAAEHGNPIPRKVFRGSKCRRMSYEDVFATSSVDSGQQSSVGLQEKNRSSVDGEFGDRTDVSSRENSQVVSEKASTQKRLSEGADSQQKQSQPAACHGKQSLETATMVRCNALGAVASQTQPAAMVGNPQEIAQTCSGMEICCSSARGSHPLASSTLSDAVYAKQCERGSSQLVRASSPQARTPGKNQLDLNSLGNRRDAGSESCCRDGLIANGEQSPGGSGHKSISREQPSAADNGAISFAGTAVQRVVTGMGNIVVSEAQNREGRACHLSACSVAVGGPLPKARDMGCAHEAGAVAPQASLGIPGPEQPVGTNEGERASTAETQGAGSNSQCHFRVGDKKKNGTSNEQMSVGETVQSIGTSSDRQGDVGIPASKLESRGVDVTLKWEGEEQPAKTRGGNTVSEASCLPATNDVGDDTSNSALGWSTYSHLRESRVDLVQRSELRQSHHEAFEVDVLAKVRNVLAAIRLDKSTEARVLSAAKDAAERQPRSKASVRKTNGMVDADVDTFRTREQPAGQDVDDLRTACGELHIVVSPKNVRVGEPVGRQSFPKARRDSDSKLGGERLNSCLVDEKSGVGSMMASQTPTGDVRISDMCAKVHEASVTPCRSRSSEGPREGSVSFSSPNLGGGTTVGWSVQSPEQCISPELTSCHGPARMRFKNSELENGNPCQISEHECPRDSRSLFPSSIIMAPLNCSKGSSRDFRLHSGVSSAVDSRNVPGCSVEHGNGTRTQPTNPGEGVLSLGVSDLDLEVRRSMKRRQPYSDKEMQRVGGENEHVVAEESGSGDREGRSGYVSNRAEILSHSFDMSAGQPLEDRAARAGVTSQNPLGNSFGNDGGFARSSQDKGLPVGLCSDGTSLSSEGGPTSPRDPFSEERIQALIEAGTDVLAAKSGNVRHSPTEKPQEEKERNPWSPVKKYHFGPFDCTKLHRSGEGDSLLTE
ncbi:hypothetical protein CBR_g19214 [Chara braunii]|uniref:Uncharacterized protein n=1 Tax=Chara braunii TaxID=69332 RepID=A0A388JTP3_CHABU|nr:hypothetical protein CBR_g19214 [Chara braunii]|eukprot:GBG61137.1 hypothetical protein CBR_g19214 [Chara braunii]